MRIPVKEQKALQVAALEGRTSLQKRDRLANDLRRLPAEGLAQLIAGLKITCDGITIGNGNINITVKNDMGREITQLIDRRLELVPAPRQVPAPVPDFKGREREIEELIHALRKKTSLTIF